MRDSDHDYYRRRIADATAQAASTTSDEARLVHRQLADLYRARLAEREIPGKAGPSPSGLTNEADFAAMRIFVPSALTRR